MASDTVTFRPSWIASAMGLVVNIGNKCQECRILDTYVIEFFQTSLHLL